MEPRPGSAHREGDHASPDIARGRPVAEVTAAGVGPPGEGSCGLSPPDPLTTYGVKGVGEVGLVPTSGAVASALHRFDGVWRTRLPMRGSAAARAILPSRLHEADRA